MSSRKNRSNSSYRPLSFQTEFTQYAEGSVLAQCGQTRVLCNASVTDGVPKFLKDAQQGWLTAEYSMLPRATHTRNDREACRGKQTGRTIEIQRLIGRSLRSCIDLKKIPEHTIMIDCDVLQADGGTRTTAINGAVIAAVQAIQKLQYQKKIHCDPIKHLICAMSLGLVDQELRLDLDYDEDHRADVDCNIVLTEDGDIVEIQATAEGQTLPAAMLVQILELAQQQRHLIIAKMRSVLGFNAATSSAG